MSSTQSQIAEKIRMLSETNRKREEAAQEAEKKMAEEGYKSEPVAEQVMPTPKKKKKKKVTVKQEHQKEDAALAATSDIGKPSSEGNHKSTLEQSMVKMETLLEECEKKKAEKTKDMPAQDPGEEDEKVKTTVKESPRHKGPHTVKRRTVKHVEKIEVPEQDYCIYEPLTGKTTILLRESTVIGKSTRANIVINNRFVSRTHAKIKRTDEGFVIEDLNSTNGTFVNGEELDSGQERKLEAGDNITLAATELVFDIVR